MSPYPARHFAFLKGRSRSYQSSGAAARRRSQEADAIAEEKIHFELISSVPSILVVSEM